MQWFWICDNCVKGVQHLFLDIILPYGWGEGKGNDLPQDCTIYYLTTTRTPINKSKFCKCEVKSSPERDEAVKMWMWAHNTKYLGISTKSERIMAKI